MYLSRLRIRNYRSIKDLDVLFEEGKNIIVGRNNSGKSNILKAIDLLLGEKSPTYERTENITDNDFYKGDTGEDLFIFGELSRVINPLTGALEPLDFSDMGKSAFVKVQKSDYGKLDLKLEDYLADKLDRIFYFETEKGSAELDSREKYRKEWVGGRTYCKSSLDDEFGNIKKIAFAFTARKEDGKIKKELAFFYTEDGKHWEIGANAGSLREAFLQSAIIPAFRDTKDQLRINNWTWYGKLLKASIDTENTGLEKAFGEVKKASGKVFKKLQEKVCDSKINIAFPNTKISFQFNPDTKQDVYKNALIYVDDGFNSELKDKGSGIQSAVVIGLFDYYIREISNTCGSLLAIEEPELYLHPHGRRVISDRLDHFLEGGRNQVIATTHSPEFIVPVGDNVNVISIQKTENEGTEARNVKFREAKRKQILIRRENAEIFFADFVILTEDAKYILEECSKLYGASSGLGKNWLNENNVSILNIGGKKDFWKYVEVLKELKIPYAVVPDFDFLKNGLSEHFTKLGTAQEKKDALNALRPKINFGAGKDIQDILDPYELKKVSDYITSLKEENIYLLSGELEKFYLSGKEPPSHLSKEQGVLETLSKMIEEEEQISDYFDVKEFENIFSEIFPKPTAEEEVDVTS